MVKIHFNTLLDTDIEVMLFHLCIKHPQTNAYAKYFDKNNKHINLLVNKKEILKKYFEIWNKIKILITKEFDNEPVYNDKKVKTKIKLYNYRLHKNFQNNKIPKDKEYCTYLSVILLDSIFVSWDKDYYPQMFLEEWKYVIKDRKIVSSISEDLELSECNDESDE